MGLDNSAVTFLLAARAAGVDYSRTVTLGRQNFYPSPAQFQRTIAACGVTANLENLLAARDGFAEPFFELLGAREVASIDASAYEGASLIHDLNDPIPDHWKGQFTAVVDSGSLEHVFDFPRALQNAVALLAVGGHFLSITPANNYLGHGFYQFSPELFFRVFTRENGYHLKVVLIQATEGRSRWYKVLDPEAIGRRAELQSGLPALLYVMAQKLEDKPLFAKRPRQSDYVAAWKGKTDGPTSAVATPGARWPAFLKALLRRLLPLFADAPFVAKSHCFRAVEERELLAGRF